MDYNFHSEVLFGDAYSKHILIILVMDSWNFRKLRNEFEYEEMWTEHKRANPKAY